MCSSYQAHYYSSITVRSPPWSELCVEFFLWGGLFSTLISVCRCRSPQIGCVFFTVKSILSISSAYSLLRRLGLHCVICWLKGVSTKRPGISLSSVAFLGYSCRGFLLGTISVIGYLPYAGVLSDQLFPPYVRARLFPCHQLIDHSLRPSSCIQNRSSRLHFVFSSFFLAQKNSIAHQVRRFWNSLFGRH